MYAATKGCDKAMESAHDRLAEARRGDPAVAALSAARVRAQLALAAARAMAEGSFYDPDLAAPAIRPARGDLIEAIFLIRACRATLPRFGAAHPAETGRMACIRRIRVGTAGVKPGGKGAE